MGRLPTWVKYPGCEAVFTCETYHCKMAEEACVKRQQNAAAKSGWKAGPKAGLGDYNCLDCEQGRRIAASIGKDQVAAYSKDLIDIRSRAGARKGREAQEKIKMAEEKKTKVCTDPACPHKGEPQPIEHFRANHKSKDGRLNTCNTCMGRRMSDGHKKKIDKKNKGTVPDKPTPPPAMPKAPAAPSNGHTITIDFNGHQDLLDGLKEKAAGQLRTPENQLLYLVKQFVSQPPGTWA